MLQSFFNVGQQVAVLFILIAVGFLLTKLSVIKESGAKVMTDVVLYAVTPCVIINAFQREFEPSMLGGLLIALLCAFCVMIFSVLLAELLYRRQKIERAVVLKFAVVFSNCGFMALPLQEAVLGSDGVFYGAAYIAVFNLFMWTYGLVTMSGKREKKEILKAVVNPGVIGTLIGVLFFVLGITLPDIVKAPISFLASLNTPVPMLIIGFYLATSSLKRVLKDKDAYISMAVRLLGIPLLALFVMYFTGVDGMILSAVVIASSSPVAAFSTMMSAKYHRDTELSAGIVCASTLFSLVTMPLVVGLARYLVA